MYFRINEKYKIIRQPYGAAIWDMSRHDYLVTNHTGRCILEACDGTVQLGDIISRVKASFRSKESVLAQATEDVRVFAEQALRNGLISQFAKSYEGQVSVKGSVDQLSIIRAEISVTDKCNLRCSYCCAESEPASHSHDLTTLQWIHVFNLLKTAGLRKVTITGGEPLVRSDIRVLLKWLCENHIAVSLLSNGMLINESTADFLAHLGNLIEVKISVDAIKNPRLHDAERGDGSCQRAVRALSVLRDYGIPTVVNMTVHRLNISELHFLAEWCSKHGHQIEASPITLEGRALQDYCLSPEEEASFWQNHEKAILKHPGAVVAATTEYFPVWSPEYKCALIYGAVGVSAQGKLLPCLRAESFFSSLQLGLESTDDLTSLREFVIEDTDLYSIIRPIYSCFVPSTEICLSCEYLMRYCNGCVVAQHAMQHRGLCVREDL